MKDEIIKKLYNILNLESGGNWNVILDEVLCFIMSSRTKIPHLIVGLM